MAEGAVEVAELEAWGHGAIRGPTPTTARKGRRQTEQNKGEASGAAGATKVRK